MARTRNVILPIEVKPAKKLCRCSHDKKHVITKASIRVVVKEPSGMGEKGYCAACGRAMLVAARQRLDELQAALEPLPSSGSQAAS